MTRLPLPAVAAELGLAVRSVRHRATGFVASFVAVFLGAVILMSFASLLDTATGAGVDATTRESMVIMASVVGGWGLVIVAFAVVSTLTLLLRQRRAELALLASVGATPAQIGRMIIGEAVVVAVVAAAAAVPVALLGGRLLLRLLIDAGQVPVGVTPQFGRYALAIGMGITVVAAVVAAVVTARRAAAMRATAALVAATLDQGRMSRKRIVLGVLLVCSGVSCGVLTGTVLRDLGYEVMAVAGQAVIQTCIGLAVLAPALVRGAIGLLAVPVRRLAGVSGYLTVLNVRQRTHQLAGALVPIILFTGIATGTLYLQSIENGVIAQRASQAPTGGERIVETLNFVIVGMIALFAAIMLINTLVAATVHRRREFGQQRLAGSTPPQVLRMVSAESAVLVCTGVLCGSVASVVAIVPYGIARAGTVLPDATIGIYLAVVAAAVVLTLASSVGAAGTVIRTPAVHAVA